MADDPLAKLLAQVDQHFGKQPPVKPERPSHCSGCFEPIAADDEGVEDFCMDCAGDLDLR